LPTVAADGGYKRAGVAWYLGQVHRVPRKKPGAIGRATCTRSRVEAQMGLGQVGGGTIKGEPNNSSAQPTITKEQDLKPMKVRKSLGNIAWGE